MQDGLTELLTRYPNVSGAENQEILEFMKTGRHLDIGLLTSNEKLRPNIDVFMQDHQKHFRVGFREAATIAGLIAALLVACWVLWG